MGIVIFEIALLLLGLALTAGGFVISQYATVLWIAGLVLLVLAVVAFAWERRKAKLPHRDTAYRAKASTGGIAVAGHGNQITIGNSARWMPVTAVGVGDGIGTRFATTSGYAPGTLSVWIDGLAQIANEDDPRTGRFSLAFAPATGESVFATWQVADQ